MLYDDVMESTMTKRYRVLTSVCDAQGLLGVKNVFDLFMDLAAEHAAILNVGHYEMLNKGLIWVAVRTRVRIYRRPRLGEQICAETWPGKPGLVKSDRFYRLSDAEEILAEGRTEWAVQDVQSGTVRRSDSYGFPEICFTDERVCSEKFTRFGNMSGGDELHYIVSSMDIDLAHHMNNTAYIRMLLGTFSTKELNTMDIEEAEISYRLACYEGEKLTIRRIRTGNTWGFQVEKSSGETAVHAILHLRGVDRIRI